MNNLYQQLQTQAQSQTPHSQVSQQSINTKLSTQQNNLLSQFLNSSNPEDFIKNMVMSNPKMQNVLQLFQTSNLTPKDFFYQYAQQKGIDPNQFINSLTQE